MCQAMTHIGLLAKLRKGTVVRAVKPNSVLSSKLSTISSTLIGGESSSCLYVVVRPSHFADVSIPMSYKEAHFHCNI